jgi:hypothetical protein
MFEGTDLIKLNESVQTFLTNPSKLYPCKIPTVITEILDRVTQLHVYIVTPVL